MLTQGEIDFVKSINLPDILTAMGYQLERKGNSYTMVGADSFRIGPQLWHRFSQGSEGGDIFNFCSIYHGWNMVQTANYVNGLVRGNNVRQLPQNLMEKQTASKFELPPENENYRRMYAYLHKQRGLSYDVIDFFREQKLIYEESQYHNIVFVSFDVYGVPRHAHVRSSNTYSDFRGDVKGNDKRYGFCLPRKNSQELVVVEGQLDVMSYYQLFPEHQAHILALGMTSVAPLQTYLKSHKEIKRVIVGLDNDLAGKAATEDIMTNSKHQWPEDVDFIKMQEYQRGYSGYKDFNEMLTHHIRDSTSFSTKKEVREQEKVVRSEQKKQTNNSKKKGQKR